MTTPLRLIAGAVVMSEQAAIEAKIRAAEWVGQEIEQLGVGIERLIGVGFGVWESGQLEVWKGKAFFLAWFVTSTEHSLNCVLTAFTLILIS